MKRTHGSNTLNRPRVNYLYNKDSEYFIYKYESFENTSPHLAKCVDRLCGLDALEEIIHPVLFMHKRLKEGERLNGMVAVQLAEDAEYLRGIATSALEALTGAKEEAYITLLFLLCSVKY